MLHLLIGPDRVSLSDLLMEKVCSQAEMGRDGLIVVVPEQYSHEAERRLCRYGGDTISRYAEVLSPSRLADRVAACHGGAAKSYLDHGGRVLAMALATEQISSRLKMYGSVLRRPEFLVSMISVIDEFQSYCLQPEVLFRVSAQSEGEFAQKLEELGLLYEAYLSVCANGSADPAGKLSALGDVLADTGWGAEKCFFFDGFSDFTGAEERILEQLLLKSTDVWVAIAADSRKAAVFRPALDTIRRLRMLAAKHEICSDLQSDISVMKRSEGVSALLERLFTSESVPAFDTSDIILRAYSTVEEECRAAVMQAKQLLSQGVRCRDIAIACTDPEQYDAPLRSALLMADLPFYTAGKDQIIQHPVARAVLSALRAAVGPMDYEDMADYLKSGLPLLERDRCDRLDYYAYQWNLFGSAWEKDWDLHPRGFGETWTEDDKIRISVLNQDRLLALQPLFVLRKGLHSAKNTGDMVLALYEFLETVSLRDRLEQQANAVDGQAAQELVQLHEIICNSLEQTWMILQTTVRSPEDFCKLYETVLSQYHVGTIPAGVDQVYVGAMQDLRSRQVCHLLVLGASDGAFPSYKTSEGLLTEEERKKLILQGISLAPSRADQIDRELGQIGAALAAATDTLWLSYAGEQPAWLFRRAQELFSGSFQVCSGEFFLDVPSYAAWRLRHEDRSVSPVQQLPKWENDLKTRAAYSFTSLNRDTVKGLYGNEIYLSASRIDKYASCRFAFFLSYGLKAAVRKQAKLDPSAFGTFVHAVLENTVLRVKSEGGFRVIAEERLLQIASEEIAAYAAAFFPQQAQRDAFLFIRSQTEILDIVRDLGNELRCSLFEPVSCELEFSGSGQLPAIKIDGKDASCKISGFVDRVDLYEANGKTYVRVVDYKTGRKDFDYTDILNGAGLQMLIYLFALKSFGAGYYDKKALSPAGVLYLPARKTFALTEPLPDDGIVSQMHQDERRRRGLISSDPAVLAAMEEDPANPQYMPYKIGKDGPSGDLADAQQMDLLENHVLKTLADLADSIACGNVMPNPIFRGNHSSCRFCDYQSVCHKDLCNHEHRVMAETSAEKFWEKLRREAENHG